MAKKEIRHSELVSESQNIDAPYELPEGWKWCKQSEVCKLIDGEKIADKEYPYLEVKYLRGTKEKSFVTSGKLIKKGTKVILVDGENSGEVFAIHEDGYMGSTFKALSIENVDENYLQYFITTKKDLYRNNKKGSAIPHLNKDLFKNMPFPLPPTLAEQQRIVNRIESMFAKLDEAKEKAQTVVDSFETRKAAILHKAFTGQLRIDKGELSIEDWEEKSFSELGTTNLGKMLDANKNTGDDVQYLRNINVRWFDFDLSDVMTMKAKPEEIKKLSVKKGDLFICEGGEPGRCAVWKDADADMIFQKAIHRFRPNEGVFSEFIAYELYYLNQIGKLANYFTGTTIKHLTGQSLAKIPIKLPPLNYQLSIVNFLDSVLEKESRAKGAAQTVLNQIALLKKSILARAFRGEV
ncbi:MAG: restriction endonuclease subunit S [Treponema sp.]|nr:restriction endonuclease subunit S [Treponema sp.]